MGNPVAQAVDGGGHRVACCRILYMRLDNGCYAGRGLAIPWIGFLYIVRCFYISIVDRSQDFPDSIW